MTFTPIQERSPIPKYHRLREHLQAQIERGRYTKGDQLPPLRLLAARNGITVVTAIRAIGELDREGWITRVHGKGIFVARTVPRKPPERVAVLMATRGHFFGNLFGMLANLLGSRKATVFPAEAAPDDPSILKLDRGRFRQFLSSEPDHLIIDGNARFPFGFLADGRAELPPVTFVFRCETPRAFPQANRVLADFEAAGRLAALHLAEAGVRKIAYLGFQDPSGPGPAGLGPVCSLQHQFFQGLQAGLREMRIAAKTNLRVIMDELPTTEKSLAQAWRDGFTGFICAADHRALRVYRMADRLNLAIGRDVQVVGLYNTPWATELSPALTSISFEEEAMAKETIRLICAHRRGGCARIVPRIVQRDSTRSRTVQSVHVFQ